MSVIDINKGDKKALRQELKQYFGIEEKMLFEDVYGFALVNNVAHKVDLLKSKEDYLDEALKEKDPSKKIEIYKEALKINSDKDVVYAKMGLAYLELEKYNEAIDAYKEALKINPSNDEAHCNMGFAYFKLKESKEAIDAYKKALKINPDNDVAHCNMGLAYLELKEPKKAIASCEKALKINPDNEIARKVLRSLNSK